MRKVPGVNTHIFKQPDIPWGLPLLKILSRYGNIEELWTPDNITSSEGLISSFNGVNGNNLTQSTDANKFRIGSQNGKNIIRKNKASAFVTATNPFSSVTDGTMYFIYKTNVNDAHIAIGDGTNTGYVWIALDAASTPIDKAFGSPSYYFNGSLSGWTTRQDIYNDVTDGNLNVVTAKGINLSAWVNFNIGSYAGTSLNEWQGDMLYLVIYSENHSDSVRSEVEQLLISYANNIDYDTYTESFTKVVDDTNGGNTLANTGLDYDAGRDEIIVAENWQTGGGDRVLIYDRQTLTLTTSFEVDETQIQGVAYDSDSDRYYVVGGNDCGIYQRNGTKDNTILSVSMPNSSMDYYNGYVWYFDYNTLVIQKRNKTDLSIIENISINPVETVGVSNIEGLHVDVDGYILGEGFNIRAYTWDGKLRFEIAASSNETEGLTMDSDGNIYNNKDLWIHGGTPNGNRVYKFTKS
jgi:hypothetical protein